LFRIFPGNHPFKFYFLRAWRLARF